MIIFKKKLNGLLIITEIIWKNWNLILKFETNYGIEEICIQE